MKTYKYIFLLGLLSFSTSCTKIMMLFYGIHQPKTETEESIYDYLNKKKINDNNVYFFKDSVSYIDFIANKSKISKVYIYNHDQFLLQIIQKDTCSAQTDDMIIGLSLTNNYQIDKTKTLDQLLPDYVDRYGNELTADSIAQSDFYIVMYWAKFTGKFNKKNISFWEDELNKKKNEMKIEIFKVCCDPMESWWSED